MLVLKPLCEQHIFLCRRQAYDIFKFYSFQVKMEDHHED